MVFSSPVFLFLFLPAVFLMDRILPDGKGKNLFLALSSVLFYAFGQLVYVPLFLFSVCLNYASGLLLQRLDKFRKAVLWSAVILNLGMLGVFKYTDFVLQNCNLAFGTRFSLPGIVLPIGISFFIFQGMSYVIDVYRDKKAGTESFSKVLLYIAFFPQLIAGPIVKYHDISSQIDARCTSAGETAQGIRRFIIGFAKKILIANSVGAVSDSVFGLLSESVPDTRLAWLGAVCYMLQIYFDFSGYSDMAIGIGHMFGFSIPENFDHPYGASSIREFWRRWHISLSAWFREYLYIPLGGNRKGKRRTSLNRMIVFLATGIWHGANWTFLVWGVCHGILSNLENSGIIPVERLQKSKAGKIAGRLYTLLAVLLLFVVFRADSLRDAGTMIRAMFSLSVRPDSTIHLVQILNGANIAMILLGVLFAGNLPQRFAAEACVLKENKTAVLCKDVALLTIFFLSVCAMARGGFNPFIYFQF